jgi:transcriptional regulator
LTRTVNIYESTQPNPWRVEDQDAAFIQKLLGSIVGFEIAIEKLEGKWKLNQNQSAARRERVIHTLEQSTRYADREIAASMRSNDA